MKQVDILIKNKREFIMKVTTGIYNNIKFNFIAQDTYVYIPICHTESIKNILQINQMSYKEQVDILINNKGKFIMRMVKF